MGHWQERIVFVRDFAFNSPRFRMATNIGDAPATTFAELLSGPLVDIYVGPSKRHWALHRNLLCHHSEQLAAELLPSNDAKKKTPDKLELLDDDPSGFELLVKWLYQGKLDDVSDMADPNRMYDYAVYCHKLYLLCERFDMPQLKNIAMDQYRKGLSEAELVPDADEINEIYRKSSPGSPFRRLMTKIAARQIMDPASEKDAESYRACFDGTPDFAIDLVNAIRLGTGGMLFEDPTEARDDCTYHDHDAGPNCHIKGKGRAKPVYKASSHRRRVHKPAPPAQTATAPAIPSASVTPPPTANITSPRQALPTADPLPPVPPPPLPSHPTPHSAPQTPQPRPPRRPGAYPGGPLRRASSTVSTSTETATAATLSSSPQEAREKFRARATSASGARVVGLGLEEAMVEEQQEEVEEQAPLLPPPLPPPSTVQNGLRQSYEGALRRQASRSSLASKSSKTVLPEAGKTSKTSDSGKSDRATRDTGSVDNPKPSKSESAISSSISKNDDRSQDDSPESPSVASVDASPPRRRIWDWARVGVSVPGLGIMSRRSHSDLKASMDVKDAPASQPIPKTAIIPPITGTQDDFSVPSAVSTVATTVDTGLESTAKSNGISNSIFLHPPLSPLHEFAETKSSSDDIVAESNGHWADSAAVTPIKEPNSFAEPHNGDAGEASNSHAQGKADVDSDDDHASPKNDEQKQDSSNFWTEDAKGVAGAIFAKAGGLTKSRWAS